MRNFPRILLACALLALTAQQSAGRDSGTDTARAPLFRLCATYAFKAPQGTLSESWGNAHAFGLTLLLPTPFRVLRIAASADAARLPPLRAGVPDVYLIEGCCAARAEWFPRSGPVGGALSAGLVSSIIFLDADREAIVQPLAVGESEYGFRGGVEVLGRLGRVYASVPLSVAYVLSRPARFVHVDIGLSAGVEF